MSKSMILQTDQGVIVGVPMMDETEAREYLKMLRWDLEAADQALTNFRARALDFAEREGWRVLGYAGAIEALQTELGAQYSKSYLSRILQAGEIERVLELPIGQLPERTLRPLSQLDTPEQQRQAYQAVEGKPTAAKMQQAVDQVKPPADITDDERRIAALAGYIWEGSDLIPGKQAVYHFTSTGGVIDGATMTRPQFDAWLKIHTPIERSPITPESRDADGPWFKASKSANHPTAHHWNVRPSVHSGQYLTACGIASATLPTTGADAGLCSVCAKHGDRRELVPIPVAPIIPPAAPDLSSFGFAARVLPDGRIAIRVPGNLESQHTHQQLNDLVAHWRSYPPIPADLAAMGVAWCYRQDGMYQVARDGRSHHTGYTAAECLTNHRAYLERTGVLDTLQPNISEGVDTPSASAEIAPLDMDDADYQAAIRDKAKALRLELVWESDDRVTLFWPGEDLEQVAPMYYGEALKWLDTEAAKIAQHRAELNRPSPAAILPAVPPRPKRPVSADASAVIAYLKQMETYASALESVIQALQKRMQ